MDVLVGSIALSAQNRSALRKFRLRIEHRTASTFIELIERVKDDAIRTESLGNETIAIGVWHISVQKLYHLQALNWNTDSHQVEILPQS
jgi:hypothetical protein